MPQPVDILWRVRGDCVRAGHGWCLYAALKSLETEAVASHDVSIGPIEGTRPLGRGLVSIHGETRLRVRAPVSHIDGLLRLTERDVRVGAHFIQLLEPVIHPLRPASELYAEMVTFSFAKPGSDRSCPSAPVPVAAWWGRLRLMLEKRSGYRGVLLAGARRKLSLKAGQHQFGFPAAVTGLTPEQSIAIQSEAIGGRRHMGAGMFRPGRMPKWLKGSRPQTREALPAASCVGLPASFRLLDQCEPC